MLEKPGDAEEASDGKIFFEGSRYRYRSAGNVKQNIVQIRLLVSANSCGDLDLAIRS